MKRLIRAYWNMGDFIDSDGVLDDCSYEAGSIQQLQNKWFNGYSVDRNVVKEDIKEQCEKRYLNKYDNIDDFNRAFNNFYNKNEQNVLYNLTYYFPGR